MPNIASVLKEEISRLARRETRKEIQVLRKASANHRRQLAALKRVTADLNRRLATLARSGRPQTAVQQPTRKPTRFVAKGLRSMRSKLGLSMKDLAKLVGVSEQSVYNWEHKRAVPREQQLERIAALRGKGKREASALLASAAPKKRGRRGR
jgi:DNA-binding transcriptional regulator YiaG